MAATKMDSVFTEGGGADLFLNNREMQRLMHGDYALVQPTEIDRKGRQEARLVRLLKSREADIVGRYFVENGVGFVVPVTAASAGHHHPGGEQGARQSQS